MEICEPCDPCESPLPSPPSSDTANSPSQSRKSRGGCSHYTRGCKLRAPCCNELFSCRFCHDTAKSENERDPQAKHCMNRHHVRSVVCEACDAEQPPGPSCTSCGHSFGQYFCSVCNLYDDDLTKQQFHCEKCGICRVGGRENFFHCETCGACYSVELRNNHVCVPNSMQRDCPICYEYLFDSLEAPQVRVHEESAHSSGGGTRRAQYVPPLCCCHALSPDSHAPLRSFLLRYCAAGTQSTANASSRTPRTAATPARYATRASAICAPPGFIWTRRYGRRRCRRSTRRRECLCYVMTATRRGRRHSTRWGSNAEDAARIIRGGGESSRREGAGRDRCRRSIRYRG